MTDETNNKLSHYDEDHRVKMVDVSEKQPTRRTATAIGKVMLSNETIARLTDGSIKKGEPLEIARIAGIMAAKRTDELIPLCHQMPLDDIKLNVAIESYGVEISSEVTTFAKTGVEMEALTAVSVAALTIYDMCKSVQRDIVISDIKVTSKTGGKANFTA